jgi:sodium transport system ATP-binding protein
VGDLRDQGKCIIYSTHIMREVERLCDRIAIVHRGRIVAEGTLASLLEEHGEQDFEELFFRLIAGVGDSGGASRFVARGASDPHP